MDKLLLNIGKVLAFKTCIKITPGWRQIGDFARAKDTLSEIIVDIDTRIY